MKSLAQLKEELLADGVIDAAEVIEVETALFADGKIDKEEAEFLFELNNAVSGGNNHPSWEALFIKAITSFLMDDDQSEGEIDEKEAQWLYDKLVSDGQIDELEKKLLEHLKEKSKNFPEIFKFLMAKTI